MVVGVKIWERKWRKVLDYGGLIWYNTLMYKEKEEFAQGGYWERGRLIVHCSDYGNELPKVHHVELSEKSIEQIRKAFEEALRNGALERLGTTQEEYDGIFEKFKAALSEKVLERRK